MKNKKILLMYKSFAGYLPRFVEEGKKVGADVSIGHFTDLTLETNGEQVVVKVGSVDVSKFDLVYVRSVGNYHEEMTMLADYCKSKKIKLLERTLREGNVDRDHKSYEALKLLGAGLSYPESFFGSSEAILKYMWSNKKWPKVVKDTGGRRGRGVYLVRDFETVKKIFKGRRKNNYMVQEYIENDGEWRVWVIGGKVFGAMHRPVRTGELEMVGMTGSSKKVDLEKEEPKMAKLAIDAAEALEIDVAGIDMVKDIKSGDGYVLEVNRAPVFGVFERVTELNVVQRIMEWLVGEVDKK